MPPGTEAEATAACWPENHRRPGGVALRCTKRLLRRPRAVAALGKGGRRGPCDLHAHADAAGRAWGQRRAGHLPAPAAARCLDEREEHRVSTAAAASVVVSSARWAELATAAQRRGGQKPRLSDASHTCLSWSGRRSASRPRSLSHTLTPHRTLAAALLPSPTAQHRRLRLHHTHPHRIHEAHLFGLHTHTHPYLRPPAPLPATGASAPFLPSCRRPPTWLSLVRRPASTHAL
jgi:hypothetical protein